MSDALAAFGVDASKLKAQGVSYPATVSGRVCHIDADFISYQVACETRDELDGIKPRRSFDHMKKQVVSIAEHHRKMTGSESYVLYITPSGSTKGNRDSKAVTKPYQGNRKDTPSPEFLHKLRAYMGEELGAVVCIDQEADDALAQANYAAIAAGTPELAVLCSRDKDLNMVPGYYWCYRDEEVKHLDDTFGYIEWYQPEKKASAKNKPAKKLIGRGTKYFWAQCLMGDTVDNIAGLPEAFAYGKVNKVGGAAAYKFLEKCETDRECYEVVRHLFRTSKHEWVHYATQQPTTWGEALLGDMHLLWMRRKPNENDIIDFIQGVLTDEQ